jgi:hypothetical protein
MLEQCVWVAYFPGTVTNADFSMKETFLMTCSISQIVPLHLPPTPLELLNVCKISLLHTVCVYAFIF